MTFGNESARHRRRQVVNLSMTELMILLVFMAITFSFLSKEEGRNEISQIQKENEELRDEIANLQREIDELREERAKLISERDDALQRLAELQKELSQFLPNAGAPHPNSEPVLVVPKSAIEAREKKIADLGLRIADLERQINAITGKAPGLPMCAEPKDLLQLTLNADGTISGMKAWDADAETLALSIPGVSALSSGQPLSEAFFGAAAGQLRAWENSRVEPCIFRVRLKRQTRDADLYDRWLRLVRRAFYVADAQ